MRCCARPRSRRRSSPIWRRCTRCACAERASGFRSTPCPTRARSSGTSRPAHRPRQLRRSVGEAPGEHLDQLDRGVGVLADDLGKELLRDLERLELALRGRGRGARHVAEDRDLADDVVLAQRVYDDRAGGRRHRDLPLAVDHDVGGVPHVAGLEHHLAGVVGQPLGAEAQQLLHRRLDLGEDRKLPDQLDFLFQTHPVFLFSSANAPFSARRPRSITSTIEKRCANSSRVSAQTTAWPWRSRSTPSTTRACDAGSTTAAAWSSTSSAGRLSMARTSATFCRSAAASRAPPTPTWKSRPLRTTIERRPRSSSSSRTSLVMRSTAPACPVTILPNRMLSCSVAALL